MKNVWFLGLVCLLLVSCGSGGKEKSGSEDRVCACATCIAIERNTREVLEKEFADELKQGKVVFRIVDISQSENQGLGSLADRGSVCPGFLSHKRCVLFRYADPSVGFRDSRLSVAGRICRSHGDTGACRCLDTGFQCAADARQPIR